MRAGSGCVLRYRTKQGACPPAGYPFAGMAGELVRVLDGLHATPSGVMARSALVRFDDGLSTLVPLANLEATEGPRAG